MTQQLCLKTKSLAFPPLSIARYSFTQLIELGHHWRERKCTIFETVAKDIRTRAHLIASPTFYRWATALQNTFPARRPQEYISRLADPRNTFPDLPTPGIRSAGLLSKPFCFDNKKNKTGHQNNDSDRIGWHGSRLSHQVHNSSLFHNRVSTITLINRAGCNLKLVTFTSLSRTPPPPPRLRTTSSYCFHSSFLVLLSPLS